MNTDLDSYHLVAPHSSCTVAALIEQIPLWL